MSDVTEVATGTPLCPVCAGRELARLSTIAKAYPLFRCSTCTHHFLGVDESSRNWLEASYEDHYAGFRSDGEFSRFIRRFVDTDLRTRLSPPARVLDLGCGNGEFLTAIREAGYEGHGLDLSSAAVQMCLDRGLKAEVCDFLEWKPERPGFDLVTMWDVLEHLPDPLAYLTKARALLAPNGALFIKTPRVETFSVQCARYVSRLARPLLSAPGHVQFFREATLSRLLKRAGFATLEWLPGTHTRGLNHTGSWRAVVRNRILMALHGISGDSNNLVFARPRPAATGETG